MISKNSFKVQAIITKDENKQLERVAEIQGRSVSNLLAMVIRNFLRKSK